MSGSFRGRDHFQRRGNFYEQKLLSEAGIVFRDEDIRRQGQETRIFFRGENQEGDHCQRRGPLSEIGTTFRDGDHFRDGGPSSKKDTIYRDRDHY